MKTNNVNTLKRRKKMWTLCRRTKSVVLPKLFDEMKRQRKPKKITKHQKHREDHIQRGEATHGKVTQIIKSLEIWKVAVKDFTHIILKNLTTQGIERVAQIVNVILSQQQCSKNRAIQGAKNTRIQTHKFDLWSLQSCWESYSKQDFGVYWRKGIPPNHQYGFR